MPHGNLSDILRVSGFRLVRDPLLGVLLLYLLNLSSFSSYSFLFPRQFPSPNQSVPHRGLNGTVVVSS